MNKPNIRYGGSVCGKEEEKAIIKSVKESIKSGGWQAGPEASKMEREASRFLGVEHGLLTTSGSCAGLLALQAMELPKGSEVIISACTFPTIFNIILQCGLVPVVVDAKVGTYNFDVDDVENAITDRTSAIIAIHALGNPVDMPKLMKMLKKYPKKIWVMEDGCDTWGGSIRGKMIGSFGDVSITSFHAAHIVSMGVGGGVFTNDKGIATRARQYRDWGRQADATKKPDYPGIPEDYDPRFVYDKIGYNFQILELQAAMGRVQLRKAEKIKKLRKANFEILKKELSKFDELTMPKSIMGADVCWFAFPITVIPDKKRMIDRGSLVKHLNARGIETRSMFSGNITAHPAYRDSEFKISGTLHGADYIMKNSFWVSCHPRMTDTDRKHIVEAFKSYFNA